MAHVMQPQAIGSGALVWLQSYDEDEYSMVLLPATVDDVHAESILFETQRGLLCGWREDYNYRFGWRCWDAEPSQEEIDKEPFE